MSGDIFYSQVNPSVQAELNARGLSGKRRTTEDLNFMLGKIANTRIIAYGKKKSTDTYSIIPESELNGNTVRSGEFLPGGKNGFLADRQWKRTGTDTTTEQGVNTSKRIPPYVTGVDINITDHSVGLLNSCTFNITVPNPERDLEYIESIYCRPGRPVRVDIEYPDSAVLSGNNIIESSSMASLAALKISEPAEPQYLNRTKFQGLIINFSIDYQTDMTAIVNVTLRGTTNVFTDVTAIVDSSKQKDVKTQLNPSGSISLFQGIREQFETAIDPAAEKAEHSKTDIAEQGLAYVVQKTVDNKTYYGLTGKINPTGEIYKYISLGWLINYINRNVLTKIENATLLTPKIILDNSVAKSGVNDHIHMLSSDPYKILLPDFFIVNKEQLKKIRQDEQKEEGLERNELNLYYDYQFLPQDTVTCRDEFIYGNVSEYETTGLENIMIELSEIEKSYDIIQDKTTHLVKLNDFLNAIFAKIKAYTGNFIDLKLITHPDDDSLFLLYNISYKSNIETTQVVPYSVPMFANHVYGSCITDFKFSGKMPTDSANLAFAINDLDSDTDTSDIAPFLNFMYSSNELSRSRTTDDIGNTIVTDSVDPLLSYAEISEIYDKKRGIAFGTLNESIRKYRNEPNKQENKDALYNALYKWVPYVRKDLKENINVKTPIIPFEVEFTTNGINGLKWGDVLTFDGLPSRYKRNTVFSIISITHNVNDIGEWKTNIRCLTRARID